MSTEVMQGNGLWTDFKAWAAHPFSADMRIWPDYVLLIGVTLIIILFWSILLRHLFRAIGET